MTLLMSTTRSAADITFAPHPLHEADSAPAARRAEGVPRPAPSASLTFASEIARAILEVAVLAMLVLNIWIWAGVLGGRV